MEKNVNIAFHNSTKLASQTDTLLMTHGNLRPEGK